MVFLTSKIKDHFDNMQPGETIDVWNAKLPITLIHAAKEYIDQGGQLQFSNDYSEIRRLPEWQ